jgi:outer membrane protein assembly factor BamB
VRWSASESVLWKLELPGRGGSTPVVWDERIFLTCGDEGQNAVICLDRQGEKMWTTHVGRERPGKHQKGSGANPSPVTDGQHVFVYFKSGDLACLDYQGQIVWQKNLQDLYGEDTLWWDLGTSPVLTKDLVVVACIHSGPSYLVGLEKDSGEIAWKHDRNLDAPDEALQTYATPMPAEVNGREMLVVLGADHVTAHDTSTGDEIWRVGGLNPEQNRFFRSIASPVVDGEIVVVPYARGGSLTAIRIDGQGDVTDSHIVWSKEGREKIVSADVPTPAARDGRLYLCTDRGVVVCMDIQTGDVIWEGQVERSSAEYSASPIIADGKLYVTREDGLTSVLDLSSDEFKLLSVNNLNEFVVATPAFVDGRILIRTDKHLYCIGQ